VLVARAYGDATEDGSSPFAFLAREALEYLEPGDGVWAGALGLTAIPMQIFGPADAAADLEAARARLDGLQGDDADHDRATLDFYLGGALLNDRRLDAGTEVFQRSAATMARLEPTSLVRLWSASGVAIGQTLLGRADDALDTLDEVEALVSWTDWGVEWAFARAFALARRREFEAARLPLLAIAARFGSDSPSPLVPTVVAGFGVVADAEGQADRAEELFALLTATRSPASSAAMYEVIGRTLQWPDDEFANLKITRALTVVGRQSEMERDRYFSTLNALAREEVAAGGG
jgi:hypothetical protein